MTGGRKAVSPAKALCEKPPDLSGGFFSSAGLPMASLLALADQGLGCRGHSTSTEPDGNGSGGRVGPLALVEGRRAAAPNR